MGISNISALKQFVKANTTGKTGTTRVSLAFDTASTATEANTITAPSNPSNPAVPATATAVTNTNAYPVQVSIAGGTVSAVKVNGTATGLTSGSFVVPSGGTISITYTAAPTWVWTNAGGTTGHVTALVDGTIVKVGYLGN